MTAASALAPFDQPDAVRRVAWLRATVGAVVAVLVALGPYDRFFVDFAPLLYTPRDPWLPDLGGAYLGVRWATVALGVAVAIGARPAVTVPLLLAGFAVTTGYTSTFFERFSYNTHLLWILAVLAIAPTSGALAVAPGRRPDTPRDHALASFALWASAVCVALVYLQAALSKLVFAGPRWFVDGTTAWTFTALNGTALGRALVPWPGLFDAFHLGAGLIELSFLPLCLVPRLRPVAAMLALAMQVGIGLVMGIWFWHLWALFPALLLAPGRSR